MRKSDGELTNSLGDAARQVQVGGLYYHYKNPDNLYRILLLAIIEENTEVCVVYEPQYGAKIPFVRTLSNWLEEVIVNDSKVKRFTLVNGV